MDTLVVKERAPPYAPANPPNPAKQINRSHTHTHTDRE